MRPYGRLWNHEISKPQFPSKTAQKQRRKFCSFGRSLPSVKRPLRIYKYWRTWLKKLFSSQDMQKLHTFPHVWHWLLALTRVLLYYIFNWLLVWFSIQFHIFMYDISEVTILVILWYFSTNLIYFCKTTSLVLTVKSDIWISFFVFLLFFFGGVGVSPIKKAKTLP